jgi:hypothetical protein
MDCHDVGIMVREVQDEIQSALSVKSDLRIELSKL